MDFGEFVLREYQLRVKGRKEKKVMLVGYVFGGKFIYAILMEVPHFI